MKKTKNKISIGDYIKLSLVVFITVMLCFVLRNWYLSRVDYEMNIPIITETLLTKINTNEVYNYIRENENAILYIGVASNQECRDFEIEFNKVIKERKLENIITYLNLSDTSNKNSFIKEFNKFYDTKLLGYPSLIIFEDGSVKDILTVKTGKKLKVEDAIKFLDENEDSIDL